jgi:acetyl esterase
MREALAISERLRSELQDLPADPIAAIRAAYAHERRYWNEVPVDNVRRTVDWTVTLAGMPTTVRSYWPAAMVPVQVLVYLHGGGFVLGSLDTHDRIMRLLAKLSGWPVIGLDYALAPEHKFPTQIDQIADAITQFPKLVGLRPKQFVFAGDSAGAHLALAATLALRDTGGQMPSALLLFYGLYGLRDSPSRRLWGGPVDGLDETSLAFFRDAYLPSSDAQHDPRYDLLTANLANLPPAFVTACALDPLLDDSRALAGLIAAAGGEAELKVYEGVLHGFLHLSRLVPTATWALEDAARFLADNCSGPDA